MGRERRLRIYSLHAWSGITLGLFLYVVSFTGCLALFERELATWEDPSRRLSLSEYMAPIKNVVADWVAEYAEEREILFVSLAYPDIYEPFYSVRMVVALQEGGTQRFHQRWNAETLEPIPSRGDGLVVWLLDIHRHLMWPAWLGGRTVGRALVGIAGIAMMLSIVSGLVTHRKMFQELFTLRINRSVRLKWKDAHNILGLWGLPFYSMIAFTGAFLGIIVIMVPLVGALIAKGDVEKLREVINPTVARANIVAPMVSFDDVYKRLDEQGNRPVSVFVTNWGDRAAVYQVNYPEESKLLRFASQKISGVSDVQLQDIVNAELTAADRVIGAITPLHYGTYGGIALKLLYLILGLSLCVMIALGIMVWLERRLHRSVGSMDRSFYRRLGHLTTGVTLGNVIASIAVFYLDKLYQGSEDVRLFWTGALYFLSWIVVIIYAFARENDYRTVRHLLILSAIGLLGLPILNGFATNDFLIAQLPHSSSHWVDISFLVSGILIIFCNRFIPRERYPKTV